MYTKNVDKRLDDGYNGLNFYIPKEDYYYYHEKVSVVLTALLLVTLFSTVAAAAGEEQSVMVNPLGMLGGALNAQYEKSLGNQSSYLVSGSFLSMAGATGFGAGAGYRKYLGNESFSALFVQGSAGITMMGVGDVSGTGVNIGGLFGFKWIYDQGFSLEVGAGGSILFIDVEGYSLGGFWPNLQVALGYSW